MDEVKTHLSYSLKYLLAVAIPFVFGAWVLAEPVLSLFSTAAIAEVGYPVVPLVALGTLFFAAYVPVAHIMVLVRKTRTMGAIWVVSAMANLGLNMLVVPRWGIFGAAVTTLAAYGLALGLTTYYGFKEFRFPIDWRFMIKSLIASGVMSMAIRLMAPDRLVATLLTVAVGIVIYAGALVLLRGVTKEEFRFFRRLVQRP